MAAMNTDTPPAESPKPTLSINTQFLTTFAWEGKDNGVPKSGFESCVVNGPASGFGSSEEIQDLSNALATTFFNSNKFTDLKVSLIYAARLPL